MTKFQAILITFFSLCILGGIYAFATYKGTNNVQKLPSITVWGTLPDDIINLYVNKVNLSLNTPIQINYTYIPENDFNKTFIEALARRQGPDAILISQDLIYKHEDKIVPIPYTALSERDFRNTFVQQAELYLGKDGVMALPFIIDPLVMYWNRDTFTNAGVAVFPKFWDEFTPIGQKINKKDSNSNIRKSTLAMGEFSNISNAREILATLLLQVGVNITSRKGDTNKLSSNLGGANAESTISAINFFTKFSDPRNADYSWNRSLPNSKSSFLSGNLATYIGYASEIKDLREKNSNIDFDISAMPQARGGKNRVSHSSMYGFSIVNSSANPGGTYSVLNAILTPSALDELVKISYLPPVRRDMIQQGSKDPYLSIFYDSALISKGWLDINSSESNRIFKNMIESITSGRKSLYDAIQSSDEEYSIILRNI